jgi:two-component system chemotaxis response regulator CheY
MNVLLVDDSRALRTLQRSVVAQFGPHHYEEASDARSALRVLEESTPDLMILDGDIPGVDALKLVKACRAKSDAVRILIMTREIDGSLADQALAAGASAIVQKPFTPDLLSQRIDESMRDAGSSAA